MVASITITIKSHLIKGGARKEKQFYLMDINSDKMEVQTINRKFLKCISDQMRIYSFKICTTWEVGCQKFCPFVLSCKSPSVKLEKIRRDVLVLSLVLKRLGKWQIM